MFRQFAEILRSRGIRAIARRNCCIAWIPFRTPFGRGEDQILVRDWADLRAAIGV